MTDDAHDRERDEEVEDELALEEDIFTEDGGGAYDEPVMFDLVGKDPVPAPATELPGDPKVPYEG